MGEFQLKVVVPPLLLLKALPIRYIAIDHVPNRSPAIEWDRNAHKRDWQSLAVLTSADGLSGEYLPRSENPGQDTFDLFLTVLRHNEVLNSVTDRFFCRVP